MKIEFAGNVSGRGFRVGDHEFDAQKCLGTLLVSGEPMEMELAGKLV
jgi:hypothetical protein